MTVSEWIGKLEAAKNILDRADSPFFIAASTTAANMSERIFIEGENKNGKTSQYIGKDVYLSPSKFRVAATDARGNPSKPRNKKNRKTVYFSTYRKYRESVGLIADRVVFENIGDLRSDFENVNPATGKPSITEVGKNHYQIVLKRKINVDKSEGLDDRYGTVFAITDSEVAQFVDILNKEIQRIGII